MMRLLIVIAIALISAWNADASTVVVKFCNFADVINLKLKVPAAGAVTAVTSTAVGYTQCVTVSVDTTQTAALQVLKSDDSVWVTGPNPSNLPMTNPQYLFVAAIKKNGQPAISDFVNPAADATRPMTIVVADFSDSSDKKQVAYNNMVWTTSLQGGKLFYMQSPMTNPGTSGLAFTNLKAGANYGKVLASTKVNAGWTASTGWGSSAVKFVVYGKDLNNEDSTDGDDYNAWFISGPIVQTALVDLFAAPWTAPSNPKQWYMCNGAAEGKDVKYTTAYSPFGAPGSTQRGSNVPYAECKTQQVFDDPTFAGIYVSATWKDLPVMGLAPLKFINHVKPTPQYMSVGVAPYGVTDSGNYAFFVPDNTNLDSAKYQVVLLNGLDYPIEFAVDGNTPTTLDSGKELFVEFTAAQATSKINVTLGGENDAVKLYELGPISTAFAQTGRLYHVLFYGTLPKTHYIVVMGQDINGNNGGQQGNGDFVVPGTLIPPPVASPTPNDGPGPAPGPDDDSPGAAPSPSSAAAVTQFSVVAMLLCLLALLA